MITAAELSESLDRLLTAYEARTIVLNNTGDITEWLIATSDVLHHTVKHLGLVTSGMQELLVAGGDESLNPT